MGGDVRDVRRRDVTRVQAKFAEVVGEVQDASGAHPAQHAVDEPGVVALDVQGARHLGALGHRGGIEDDQVEAPGDVVALEVGQDVAAHVAVGLAGEAVEVHVVPGGVEPSVGEVDGGGGARPAGCGVHREGAGVSEEVEHVSACGFGLDQGAGLAVVQEEPGVEVVGEVDVKAVAPLGDLKATARVGHAAVGAAPAGADAQFDEDIVGRHLQGPVQGVDVGVDLPGRRFVGGRVVAQAPGDVQASLVGVDVGGDLGDVAVVQAVAGDVVLAAPGFEPALVFADAVDQHLRALGVACVLSFGVVRVGGLAGRQWA